MVCLDMHISLLIAKKEEQKKEEQKKGMRLCSSYEGSSYEGSSYEGSYIIYTVKVVLLYLVGAWSVTGKGQAYDLFRSHAWYCP